MPKRLIALPHMGKMVTVTHKHYRTVIKKRKKLARELSSAELMQHMSAWSLDLLNAARVKSRLHGRIYREEPCLYVGNHVSYLDIPVIAAYAPTVFVAKSEIAKWPFIGTIAKLGGTVFVERESQESRKRSLDAVKSTLLDRAQSVALFPSGTTTLDESVPWRLGVFKLAAEHGIRIQPFSLAYNPLRRAAYIGDDALVPHLFKLLWEGSVTCDITFGEAMKITDPVAQCAEAQAWVKSQLERNQHVLQH